MKTRIGETEWFPVFVITNDTWDREVEVRPGTLKRWKKVEADYKKVQREMSEAYDKAPPFVPPPPVLGPPELDPETLPEHVVAAIDNQERA